MPSTAIVASQILDSGLTGRQLVQSATQSEAITVLGLDPSNYALLDSNNTFTGINTFDDDVTVNALLSAGSAEFGSVTINDDLLANNAEFSGSVEFTDLITGVGGEHQGDLRITNADLIVTGSGKIDAVDGDFSGTVTTGVITSEGGNGNLLLQREGTNKIALGGSFIQVYDQFRPALDGLHSNGTSALRWSNTYSVDGSFTGNIDVTNGSYITRDTIPHLRFGSRMTTYIELSPSVDNTYPLGVDGNRWSSVASVDGDFSGNVTIGGSIDNTDTNDLLSVSFSGTEQYSFRSNALVPKGIGKSLGLAVARFNGGYFTDGSFSGNLDTEVGGSNRLFNLGSDGDIDKEYLESSWSTNQAQIGTKATGTGVVRDLQLGTAATKVLIRPASNQIWLYSNSNARILCSSGGVGTGGDVYPFANDTDTLGLANNRWANVYSVDGEFSGDITVTGRIGTISGSNIDGMGTSAGYLRFFSNVIAYWNNDSLLIGTNKTFVPSSDGNSSVGIDGKRFGAVNSVDGSFTGNLDTEIGGSMRLFNLGTDADVAAGDTEYLEFYTDSNKYFIAPKRTGTGAVRNFEIQGCYGASFGNIYFDKFGFLNLRHGSSTQAAISIRSNGSELARDMFPNVVAVDTLSLGKSTARFGEFYSVDGDFSGNVTTAGLATGVQTITAASDTLVNSDHTNLCDCTSNAITVNLPAASAGQQFVIKKVDSSANTVTITGNGSETIDGAASQILYAQDESITIASNGSGWYIVSEFASPTGGNPFNQSLNTTDSPTFVDGDFSGDITLDDSSRITSNGKVRIGGDTGSVFYVGVNARILHDSTGFYPNPDGIGSIGKIGRRFAGAYFVDGSFTGNLDTEVGGSMRLFNLGTDGDTDTEYLELVADANDFKIQAQVTGTGVVRPIYLNGHSVRFTTGGNAKLSVLSTGNFCYVPIAPNANGSVSSGTSANRWSNTYSVDGDFSGVVTTLNVTGTNNLYLQNSVDSASISIAGSGGVTISSHNGIYQQFTPTGVNYRRDCIPTFDGTVNLGLDTNRWGTVYGLDGSFTGTLDTEIGGSMRLFNLGSDADVAAGDTEYLELETTGTSYNISAKRTGTGVNRSFVLTGASDDYISFYFNSGIIFGRSGTQIATFKTSDASFNVPLTPSVTGARDIGTTAKRWGNVISVDGSFTGTLDTEVGGSMRLFNLGSDADIAAGDTEYLDISGGGLYNIQPKKTGSGSTRSLYIKSGAGGQGELSLRSNGTGYLTWGGVDNLIWDDGVTKIDSDLIIESSRSLKLFNLGSDGDTDTEYLEISNNGTNFEIYTAATGSGVARNVTLGDSTTGVAINPVGQQLLLYGGGALKLDILGGGLRFRDDLFPITTNTIDLGTSSARWATVNSVDGDFSGTVNTEFVQGLSTGHAIKLNTGLVGESQLKAGIGGSTTLAWGWGGSGVYMYSAPRHRFINGLYSEGNIDTEVGGSNRLFNLGSDGDTDTEYLETSFDANIAKIEPKNTGTGILREVQLVSGNSSVEVKNGLTTIRAGSSNVFRGSGTASSYLYSFGQGTILDIGDGVFHSFTSNVDLGSTAKRWATTYSVDGDFSGDLTVSSIVSTGGLDFDIAGIYILRHNGSASFLASSAAFYPNNSKTLGTTSKRWGMFYGSDASITGTLDTEIGGSMRLFNLGSAADVAAGDTEYLDISATANEYYISPKQTGAGVLRDLFVTGAYGATRTHLEFQNNGNLKIAYGGNANILVGSSYVKFRANVDPNVDNSYTMGTAAIRWANVYSYAGDFSGTVTTPSVFNANGGTGININANDIRFARNGFGDRILMETSSFRGVTDNTMDLGVTNFRWANIYSYNGSFSGNLDTEVGGSMRLFNLGTEGDVDTEYFSIGYGASTDVSLDTKATGTGVGRKIVLSTGGNTALNITLSAIYIYRNFLPSSSSLYCGASANRWGGVYSVVGSFTGNLDTEVGGTNRLFNLGSDADVAAGDTEYLSTDVDSNNYRILSEQTGTGVQRDIRIGGYVGVAYRGIRIQPASGGMQFIYNNANRLSINSTTTNITTATTTTYDLRPATSDTYDNGTSAFRWANVASVDGSFSGNLNVEIGGAYRQYRLGADGDTDTSFFEISNTGSDFLISGKKTGAGTSSTVTLGYEGGDRLEVGFSAVTVRNAGFQPDGDTTRNLGTTTRRWARTYTNTVMTDVQTITAASDSLVSTDHTVLCDCTSNSIAIAIPASSTGTESNRYEIKKIDSTANTVTITPDSPATIDGAASQTLNFQHQSITLVSDGSNWFIV